MKITKILKENTKGVSFEFFPPKTEKEKESLSVTIKALKRYKPLYTSMTYGALGATQANTKMAVKMLLDEKELEVMPHLTCVGAKEENIKKLLQEYSENNVQNIMALRGDLPDGSCALDLSKEDFCYAKDLVKLIKKSGDFCIGVAVYPEGHIETSSLEEDLNYAKEKIDEGASFAVTQMFFDNTFYYNLLDRMGKKGINVPILPGILPLTNITKLKKFVTLCRTTIPKKMEEDMNRFKDSPEDMKKVGIDFTIKQCKDLIENGATKLHFFTLNQPEVMKTILDAIGVR